MKSKPRVFMIDIAFFIFFGVFHLHRIWAFVHREQYAGFWLNLLEFKGIFYYILMGILVSFCIIGIIIFIMYRSSNSWWRWLYIFGGGYVLFDLISISIRLSFWEELLRWMYDINNPYWNFVWGLFVIIGGLSFALGIILLRRFLHMETSLLKGYGRTSSK